jgi:cytochrome oxidase Cu insertion factor (SCO1/SenC/PrrC family)
MSKTLMATVLTFAMLLTAGRAASPPDDKPAPPPPMKIKVGDMAPDFTLLAFDGKELKKVSLHDYRGKKNVALAFYVFAFTPN